MNRKCNYIIAGLFVLVLSSCSEIAYNNKKWDHKMRLLDLDYIERLNKVKSDAELQLTINHLDSLIYKTSNEYKNIR